MRGGTAYRGHTGCKEAWHTEATLGARRHSIQADRAVNPEELPVSSSLGFPVLGTTLSFFSLGFGNQTQVFSLVQQALY